MPRAALDPVAIPGLLQNLILSDVADGGREISYRLVGTAIVEAHGFDYTGWTIQRLTSGPTLAFTQRLYGMVISRAVPVYSEGVIRLSDVAFTAEKPGVGSLIGPLVTGPLAEAMQFPLQQRIEETAQALWAETGVGLKVPMIEVPEIVLGPNQLRVPFDFQIELR